jgi:hypothetical protein
MSNVEWDESREDRIDMEIVVDAYNEEERKMGWYYYLEDKLNFPFKAKWVSGRHTSLTRQEEVKGEEVEVVEMSSEDDCQEEMFVEVLYKENTVEDTFSVPLSDIVPLEVDSDTQEAIEDWHYWVAQGYEW